MIAHANNRGEFPFYKSTKVAGTKGGVKLLLGKFVELIPRKSLIYLEKSKA